MVEINRKVDKDSFKLARVQDGWIDCAREYQKGNLWVSEMRWACWRLRRKTLSGLVKVDNDFVWLDFVFIFAGELSGELLSKELKVT